MRKKRYVWIFFIIVIVFILAFIFIQLFYTKGTGPLIDREEEICKEACNNFKFRNFEWDYLNYNINATIYLLECNCITKTADSTGFTQIVGTSVKTIYFDVLTKKELNNEELLLRTNQ